MRGPRRVLLASVRSRITVVASAAVVGVLVAAGVGLVVLQERSLTDQLEETLDDHASALVARAEDDALPPVLPTSADDDTVSQVTTEDGEVLAASTTDISSAEALADAPPAGEDPVLRTVEPIGGEGQTYRVLTQRVTTADGSVLVHVASPLDDVQESTGVLVVSLITTVPPVAAVLALLIWVLVGRALRPVEAIRAEVAGMGAADLGRRVPVPGGDDAVARLARTMNDMLARVEGAVARQQRFVADASHELRSPLTRMRAELEVDLAHPATADPVATHRSVLEETDELHRLVEDLLLLARDDAVDGNGTRAPARPVDLDVVVGREAARVRTEGRVAVDTSGVSAARVLGDQAQLARALRNVLDNAARHAVDRVAVVVGEEGGSAAVIVTDDGPGIPADEQERVFERFARLDASRSAAGGGSGLGLAIAREILERHGGTIAVDPDHHPGARLVLRLPLSSQ